MTGLSLPSPKTLAWRKAGLPSAAFINQLQSLVRPVSCHVPWVVLGVVLVGMPPLLWWQGWSCGRNIPRLICSLFYWRGQELIVTFYSLAEKSSWCPQVVNRRRRATPAMQVRIWASAPGQMLLDVGLLDACSGLGTSNHTVSFLQDKTLWWPWWEGYTVPREVGTPTEDVPRQPQTLSTIHQPFCVASCGVFTPNILPLCFSSAEAPKMSLWDYLGLALAVQPHSSMAPGAAGSPESWLAPPLWGDAPRERCPSHRTTQGSSSPSCASGCRTAVGRGLRVPSSSSAARPSRSWVSTSSSTSLWMRAKRSQGAVGLWIRRSAPCTWPRRCKKLRFLGWALGTSLLWGTMERSVGEGGRGRGIRGRCLMLGASGWQTWRKTARLGSAGECAWKTRSFLWTASWWSAWMSLVQGKTVRAACSRWFSWCVCRLWWVLIYAQVQRFWPLLFSPW